MYIYALNQEKTTTAKVRSSRLSSIADHNLVYPRDIYVANAYRRHEHISVLESRIERLENVLTLSGLGNRPQSIVEEEPSEDALADKFSNLVINEEGDSKHIGRLQS